MIRMLLNPLLSPHQRRNPRKISLPLSNLPNLSELNQKWSDRFNRLEALLLARSFEPTFSSNVKVTPTHSPLAGVVQGTEPFIRLAQLASTSTSQFPGSGFSASQHQPTSQTQTSLPTSATEFLGTGSSTSQH